MYIIYAQGYTNCKNILVDFVSQLCFSNEMPEHRWRLHYPRNENMENTLEIYGMENPNESIEDLKNKIFNERRATISTTYTPPSKWTESEIHYIDPADIHKGQALITPKYPIYKDTVVELAKWPEKMYFYQNQEVKSKDELSLLEFTVDYKENQVYINQDSILVDENTKILSDISILLHWNPGCGNQQGTCLILVDENWDIKLFMRPYDGAANTGTYNISNNLDGLEITRHGVNNKDITIKAKPESESKHKYYIFWYNTKGNDHTDCKHIDISCIDNETGEIESLNTVNINQALIQNLGDYSADTKLPLRIYDYENNEIQYDSSNHKILPLFTLDFNSNKFEISKYVYNPGNQVIKQPISENITPEAPDPDLTYSKIDYGPPIPFSIRYQTENNIAYTWYVSLIYPQYTSTYKPIRPIPYIPHIPLLDVPYEEVLERANIIIQMGIGSCDYELETRAFILNENNIVIAYCSAFQSPQYIIDSSYNSKIRISSVNSRWLEIDNIDGNEEYRIIFFNFKGNDHPCNGSQLHILRERPSTGSILDTCVMSNMDAYLTDSSVNDSSLVGQTLPSFNDKNGSPLKPNIIINHEKITLKHYDNIEQANLVVDWANIVSEDVIRKNEEIVEQNKQIDEENEIIREQNEQINKENMKYINNSYFIWQYGKEMDGNGFIKQHKNHDSPVFANFFHNFKVYEDIYDFSWNPISYYITWDEKGCAFMFCEDPVLGGAVHGFSYFGALVNFTQKLKDDYIGNFGSFGNNLLEADMQNIIVPEFDGELTTYENDRYNIAVYLRSYFGPALLQTITPAILMFLESEFLIPIEEVINTSDVGELPMQYYMIGAENLEFDKVEVIQEDNFNNYYIIFRDNSYTELELTNIDIDEPIEVYVNSTATIAIPPIQIINPGDLICISRVTLVNNSNNNIIVELNDYTLIINPNNILEDTTIALRSEVSIEKYNLNLTVPKENKIVNAIIWDFADVSYNIQESEKPENQTAPINRKILVLDFDPILTTKGGISFTEYIKGFNTKTFIEENIKRLKKASHDILNYDVVYETLNEFPKQKTGRFTEQQFVNLWDTAISQGQWYEYNPLNNAFPNYGFDYDYYLDDYNLVNRRKNNEFDEVWFVEQFAQMNESAMAGKNAYWVNGPSFERDCSLFKMIQFTKLRPDTMLECHGHAAENIMGRAIFKTDPWGIHGLPSKPQSEWTPWDKFTLYDKISPGNANVGNIHYAPNSLKDYEWSRTEPVLSNWRDWRDNYPNFQGLKEQTNVDIWKYSDNICGDHHEWWFSCFPHTTGRDEKGYSNNWWIYYQDLVCTKSLRIKINKPPINNKTFKIDGRNDYDIQIFATLTDDTEIDVTEDSTINVSKDINDIATISVWRDGINIVKTEKDLGAKN